MLTLATASGLRPRALPSGLTALSSSPFSVPHKATRGGAPSWGSPSRPGSPSDCVEQWAAASVRAVRLWWAPTRSALPAPGRSAVWARLTLRPPRPRPPRGRARALRVALPSLPRAVCARLSRLLSRLLWPPQMWPPVPCQDISRGLSGLGRAARNLGTAGVSPVCAPLEPGTSTKAQLLLAGRADLRATLGQVLLSVPGARRHPEAREGLAGRDPVCWDSRLGPSQPHPCPAPAASPT